MAYCEYINRENMRLDKFLADMSAGTRKQVKQYIRGGLVCVNGVVTKRPDVHVTVSDIVTLQGREISYEEYVYYMLNKPAGVLSATSDRRQRTVLDIIKDKPRKDMFPVGRLDKNTEGLLLICNDGDLAHRLLSPSGHVPKVYEAYVRGRMGQEQENMFERGLKINEEWTAAPADLKVLDVADTPDGVLSHVLIRIYEGKFHQIKRMFEAVGSEVVFLKRLSMGPLELDNSLKPGEYRRLRDDEIAALKGNADDE